MSDIIQSVSFPIDSDGFFRRECPLCKRDFKVLLEEEELNNIARQEFESYMTDESYDKDDLLSEEDVEYTCPYCGQKANQDAWWTEEQLNYIKIYIENIMKQMINKHLVKPLKRNFGGKSKSEFISLEFKGKELKQEEPWISPETDDMRVFKLECCEREIKIDEEYEGDKVYCFFCGFPYESSANGV